MSSYTPYRPYRFTKTFDVDTYDNGYVDYTISFGRCNPDITSFNQYVTIYKGKSLVINKKTTIDLSTVIRDYCYRHNFEYDGEQGFQPENTFDFDDGTLTAVEMLGDIYNTRIRIEFLYDSNTLSDDYVMFSIFPSVSDPYSEYRTTGVEVYRNTTIENHLPLTYTYNYWLSFDWVKYHVENDTNTAMLCLNDEPQYRFTNVGTYGNYSTSIALKELFNKIGGTTTIHVVYGTATDEIMDGGTATATGTDINIIGATIPTDGDLSDGDKIQLGWKTSTASVTDNTLAVLDGCPDEWYMAWNDTNGWHSIALASAWEKDTNEAFNIKNIYDEERNIKNTVTKSFTARTKKINPSQYSEYCHIIESTYVILYNTKTDRNYFCDITTTMTDMTKKKDNHYFEVELEEVINEIY